MLSEQDKNVLLVAAIDFGTTYSGWGFSFKHEYERDPTKVSAKSWTGGQLVSLKGPTCALVRPDGKTLDAFGFEAESKYTELVAEEEHKDWYFFQRFKMRLWEKGLSRNTTLDDTSGKTLPAKRVFALSIKYLKDDLLKTTNKRIEDGGILLDDIHWVLTVPAIWNDAAKQFMRESAIEAGIAEGKLSIALEPEAASIFCRHLPVEKSGNSGLSLASFCAGKKYIVLDAGGGTVDVTVHEILEKGGLRELHKASGGAWGGTKVDDAFLEFLEKLTGTDVIMQFKEKYLWDYIDLMREFELKKREISQDKSKIVLRIPVSLLDVVRDITGESLKEIIEKSTFKEQVSQFMGDKLKIDASIIRKCFDASVNSVVRHIAELLEAPVNSGVDTIVMVGGFSESPLLQEGLRAKFPSMKIIVPDEAGLAVLKGAVILGHRPIFISERVSKYTYGTDITAMREKYGMGKILYDDVFSTLVKAGQTLTVGEAQGEKGYVPISSSQTSIRMDIYVSQRAKPKFVTDEGCHKIGTFDVPLSGHGKDRAVVVKMIFGGTEIDVQCIEEATGNVTHLKVDFLS